MEATIRIVAWTALSLLVVIQTCVASDISLTLRGDRAEATNGLISISVDLRSGQCDYSSTGSAMRLDAAAAGIVLNADATQTLTTDYSTHLLLKPALADIITPLGHGKQFIVRHLKNGLPTVDQIFTLYPGKHWMVIQLRANAAAQIRSNWMAPLLIEKKVGSPAMHFTPATRILQAPFDNDDWHWYTTSPLNGSGASGTSHEFSTIYDSATGGGIVLGSLTHDFWKTGIDFRLGKTPGELEKLSIYGGASTDDVCPHAPAMGTTIESPMIFLGFFADFRTGLEAFGRANSIIAPPLPWHQGVPVGWMTFGALGVHFKLPQIIATSDFIRQHLQPAGFHDNQGSAAIILDGNRGSFATDDLKALVDHIHKNGQKAGCYLSPFIYWQRSHGGSLDQPFPGTHFTYAQIVLRDNHGRPIQHKPHSYALDVTHPAVRQMIANQIDHAKQLGFDYFKFDFLTEGMLEGRHFDPAVRSGMQAYNQAMRFIADRIGPDKFISLSIAPAFPSQYAQSRRISCDTYSQINNNLPGYRPFGSTQYLLNCETFSWWMGGSIYPYNDPDEMAIERYGNAPRIPETWARARIIASIVCGGNFIDTSNYADPDSAQRAEQMLTRPPIDAVARQGIAFAPVFNRSMEKDTATMFYRPSPDGTLLAIFNYDTGPAAGQIIRFNELKLDTNHSYALRDLWTDRIILRAKDHIELNVTPGDAMLLRIEQ